MWRECHTTKEFLSCKNRLNKHVLIMLSIFETVVCLKYAPSIFPARFALLKITFFLSLDFHKLWRSVMSVCPLQKLSGIGLP